MELSSGSADACGQSRFDIHVDVLKFDREIKLPSIDFFFNLTKSFFNGRKLLIIEQSSFYLGPCVSDGASDVMLVQTPVIGD